MKKRFSPAKALHSFAKTLRFVAFFSAASFFMLGCEKEEDLPVETTDIEISENVVNLDQFPDLALVSSEQDLAMGVYKYNANAGELPNFNFNSVIASSRDGGYLRKVSSFSVSGNTILLNTVPGKLEDVVKNGKISLNFDYVDFGRGTSDFASDEITSQVLEDGVETSNGVEYDFDTDFSSDIEVRGRLAFNPHFVFDMEFENATVKHAKFGVENTTLTVSPTIVLSGQANLAGTFDKNLGKVSKKFVFLVSGVPVVMDIDLALNASMRAQFDENVNTTIAFVNKSTLDFGVEVVDGSTQFFSDFQNNSKLNSAVNVEASGLATLYIIPQIYVSFYKSVSTVLKAEPYVELYARATATSTDAAVCAELNAGIDFSGGFSASILGYELFNESGHITGPRTNLWKSDPNCQLANRLVIEQPSYSSVIPGPECLLLNPGFDLLYYFSHAYHYDDGSQMPEPSQFYFSSRDNVGNVNNLSFPMTGGDPFRTITSSDFTYGMCVDWDYSDTWELSGYIEDPNGVKSNYVSWIIVQ